MNTTTMTRFTLLAPLTLAAVAAAQPPRPVAYANPMMTVTVDAALDRHAINPNIYGVAYATTAQLQALNSPLNRSGGNNASRYNWKLNADNKDNDWYFESIGDDSAVPAERADTFIGNSKAAKAEPMFTIPMLDWVAKLGPSRGKLASFSVAKYGPQNSTDYWMPDAGNGVKTNGSNVTGNDPNDANTPNSPALQTDFVKRTVAKWGAANLGGLKYYILDNEPAIWYGTHRDVQPTGVHMADLVAKAEAYSTAIKTVDPNALVVGPEEWGWTGYLYSGYDSQHGGDVGWDPSKMADRKAMGGADAMPWYLAQMHKYAQQTGVRSLDVFTVHCYPQGGEFGDDVSSDMQLRRNRSTRQLWDPNYVDETWINDKINLIPRMKGWVAANYPDTQIGITEYNWGAENHINGATAQADIFGIFGREGLDMATRWTTPDAATPTFKAMQMYRNYDNKKSTFGDTNVRATANSPDSLSSFAALRNRDGMLTIMLVNKTPGGTTGTFTKVNIKNFPDRGTAQVWQLTAANTIRQLTSVPVVSGSINLNLPNPSITLLVIPQKGYPTAALGDPASGACSGTLCKKVM